MKILWISSITFPEVIALLNNKKEDFRSSGGWMVSLANAITQASDVSLIIVSVDSLVSEYTELKGRQMLYIVLPKGKCGDYYEKQFRKISGKYSLDYIHIHGTEHKLGLHYLKACGNKNVVVSLQGVISEIANHYYDGLSWWNVFSNITLRDIIKGSIFSEKRRFLGKGIIEKKILSMVTEVIGRTAFDKSFALSVNPDIKYHYCSEILRGDFYEGQWDYSKCKKHSIFLSQSYYPVKGLHIFLKALPLVLKKYPDVEVRIAGFDFTYSNNGFINRLKRSGYGKIIRKMIRKNNLDSHIEFLGQLNAEEMKAEFLRSNVFICSSTCENSPNSLCEAQLLGTPCLASYVGGVPDTFVGDNEFFYQYDNSNLLAYKIISLFENENIETSIMSEKVRKRHCMDTIAQTVFSIYDKN